MATRRPMFGLQKVLRRISFIIFILGYGNIFKMRTVSAADTKIPLYLGAFFPVGGDWDGSGIIPAVEMALDHVNARQDILPEYELRMVWNDTKCQAGLATRVLFDQLFHEPQKLLVLGGGCSTATQAIAGAAFHWNLVTMSYAATSPALSNRRQYPYFYRTSMPDNRYNPARIRLMKEFGWNRVASIHENHEIFSLAIDDLVTLLKQANITVITSESFAENPQNQVENMKKKDAKIIVVNMYKPKTRRVICEAFKQDMLGDGYVWMLLGYYSKNWYLEDDDDIDCTKDEMKEAVEKSLYLSVASINIGDSVGATVAGITVQEFQSELHERLTRPENQIYKWHDRNPYGYDAVWAVALMLNQSVERLKTERFSDNRIRRLEDFTYDDQEMSLMFLDFFKDITFEGVSGPVRFIDGDRVNGVRMEQFKETCEEDWMTFGNECLFFVTDRLSLYSSSSQCAALGGRLTSIADPEEFILLIEKWKLLDVYLKPSQWWIGTIQNASDIEYWVHSIKSNGAFDWLLEEHPKDEQQIDESEELCVHIDIMDGRWTRTNCSIEYPYICRKSQEFIEKQIGLFLPDEDDGQLEWYENITWPGGVIPLDHTPEPVITIVRIHQGIGLMILLVMSSMAAVGILLALFFLAFNIKYRKQRTVKMSSPSLNNLILLGAIAIYSTIFLDGVDSTILPSRVIEEIITCQIRLWVFSVGFVLSFGAMFSKTWRAYKIAAFKTPKRTKSNLSDMESCLLVMLSVRRQLAEIYISIITDNNLFVMVAVLLMIDVCLLAVWQIFDPMFIVTEDFYERDDPVIPNQRLIPYVEFCTCHLLIYWLMPLYAYKGLLLIFGAFLAWETRKVSIPALNDSKLICISVYNVTILCVIGMAVSFIISEDQSALYIFTSSIITFCTSITLIVIFTPKIVSVYKYPEGKPISMIPPKKNNTVQTSSSSSMSHEELIGENQKLKEKVQQVEDDFKEAMKNGQIKKAAGHSGCLISCFGLACGCCSNLAAQEHHDSTDNLATVSSTVL